MQKFNRHINELKEQLTSNQYLLEQLNESKTMESRIKQELTITQKSLNSTGNMVFKLKLQIKDMKAQQNNLQQFKITNDKEFVELQREVNKYKNFE